MKPEFKVKVFHKGAEFSFNGGPKQKAEMYPAILDTWVSADFRDSTSVTFKVGRKKWMLQVRPIRGAKNG